jgi:hypothetical protein
MTTKIYTSLALIALALSASAQALPKVSPSPSATSGGPATMPGDQATATASASPSAKPERAAPFRGTISNVDTKGKTFTIGKEKSRTFKVTDKTTITKNGQSATIKDVAVHDDARGSYWKMPDGSMEVKTLKIGAANEQEKSKAGGAEKKEKANPSPSATASAH